MNKENGKEIKYVSPMYLGPVRHDNWPLIGNMEAVKFENYWQYSKVFPGMKNSHLNSQKEVTDEWFEWRLKGFQKTKGDRHPAGTKTDGGYLKADFALFGDASTGLKKMNYIQSRKHVYVPLYYKLLVETPAFKELKGEVEKGKKFQILDFDAPDETRFITPAFLKWAVNQPLPFGKPFGHGYVLAGALLDIEPAQYTR